MSKKIIVTTTINSPTKAILRFLRIPNWEMVIVGDKKTPHEEYRKLEKQYRNLHYMHPDEQETLYKELSDNIGWNVIQRRNLGFCYAYMKEADIIATVDDDNIPYDDWGKDVYTGQIIEVDCWKSANGVFDPLSVTNINYMWHRGYPVELLPTRNDVQFIGKVRRKVLFQANLWDGDPDVDAICRIPHNSRIKINIDKPFCSTDTAPFDSQNTFIAREALPYYMCIPHLGRMDDIWGAYVVQNKFPNSLIFNKPTVYQERNQPSHSIINDMKEEMIGYEYTLRFIRGEFSMPAISDNAYRIYQRFFGIN